MNVNLPLHILKHKLQDSRANTWDVLLIFFSSKPPSYSNLSNMKNISNFELVHVCFVLGALIKFLNRRVMGDFMLFKKKYRSDYIKFHFCLLMKPDCYEFIDLTGFTDDPPPQEGFLHSENFPNPYPDNQHCEYVLHANPEHRIILYFDEFELEPGPNCEADYVKVKSQNFNSFSSRTQIFGCNGCCAWLWLWTGWLPSIFPWLGTIWLFAVPQHEAKSLSWWNRTSFISFCRPFMQCLFLFSTTFQSPELP